jgi:hypothetical protein
MDVTFLAGLEDMSGLNSLMSTLGQPALRVGPTDRTELPSWPANCWQHTTLSTASRALISKATDGDVVNFSSQPSNDSRLSVSTF